MPRVIGLTGGIATGKTSVALHLAKRGAEVIDADEVAHRLLEPGTSVHEKISREFPSAVREDGTIDRKILGALVFENPSSRALLEAIVHPEVLREMKESIERSPGCWVVLMVPLLFEAGMEGLADEVWVVKASPENQLERLMKRNGLSRREAELRIRAQWPLEKKIALADVVIDNDRPPEEVEKNLDDLLRKEGLWEEP